MNKKNLLNLILIVNFSIIIIIWGRNMGLFRGRPSQGTSETKEAAQEESAGVTIVERKAQHSEYKDWGPNPFGITESGKPTGSYSLEGIVMDAKAPFAIINGDIRKEGDEVSGAKLVSIQKTKVILKRDKKEIVLQLFKQ